MEVYLISDTHFNHDNIATYCDRPKDFTDIIIREWKAIVRPEDLVVHLGDVAIGNRRKVEDILRELPGRKALVLGNHDRQHSPSWWMEHGFDFACQAMKFRQCWLTHEPSSSLADGCILNLHGHLHNIWHGFDNRSPSCGERDKDLFEQPVLNVLTGQPFLPPTKLKYPFQRLFAIEYTGYRPVEFDKFVQHPKKYLATGLGD